MYYDICILKIKKQYIDKTLTRETFSKICFLHTLLQINPTRDK